MANVFIEPRPKGGGPIHSYVVEDAADRVLSSFDTQEKAVAWARRQGHHPLVARTRELNDKKKRERWGHG